MRSEWDSLPQEHRRRSWTRLAAALVTIAGALALVLPATGVRPIRGSGAPLAEGESQAAPDAVGALGEEGIALASEDPAARVPGGPVAPRPASSASAGEPPTPVGEPPKEADVPDEWIVQVREDVEASEVAADHEVSADAEVHDVYTAALDGYSAHMSDEEAAEVAADPRVASVIRDRVVHATVQTTPPGISRSKAVGIAPAVSNATAVNADIAILDTGIDPNHPDLDYGGRGKNCIGSGAPDDDEGHGTHVAGTAAARNNTDHVVGVAPGARLWSVKVLDSDGSGTWAQIICGLDWVAQNAATIEVANMSLGGGGADSTCGKSDALHNAICNVVNSAQVPVVVAAGNSGGDASNYVPATYDEVITVSAYADFDGKPGWLASGKCSEQDDTLAYFSNYGPDVDLTAPGVCILSTKKGGGTRTLSGTSMATPHVAGAVAAYMAKFGKVSPATVKAALQTNGTTDWSDDSKDGFNERALNLGFLGGTDLAGGTTTTTTTTSTSTSTTSSTTTTTTTTGTSGITVTLTAGTYDNNTKSRVRVAWTGATSAVDIFWDGALVASATENDGVWAHYLGFKATSGTTYTYWVCHAGSTVCSAQVPIRMP